MWMGERRRKKEEEEKKKEEEEGGRLRGPVDVASVRDTHQKANGRNIAKAQKAREKKKNPQISRRRKD
jgi:hypothetical protein